MASVPTFIKNTAESFEHETVKAVNDTAKDVVTEVKNEMSWGQSLGLKPAPSDAEMQQQQDQSLMEDLDGFKQKLQELDKLQGKTTDEGQLDERAQKEIEKKRKSLFQNLNRFKQQNKSEADNLGSPQQSSAKQQEMEKSRAEEQDRLKREQEKQAELDNPIEVPTSGPPKNGGKPKRNNNLGRGMVKPKQRNRGGSSLDYNGAEKRAGGGSGG